MKLNERSVVHYATCDVPPDKSGFLMKKSERSGAFHRRWCVLKANLLFLFEERGRREPLGLVVLEGCTVELCESERVDFAFSIRFGQSQTHTLAADTQAEMEDWAKALAHASFQYLRLVVRELEKQLEEAQNRPENGVAGGEEENAALCRYPTGRENGISWNEPSKPEDPAILGGENVSSRNKYSIPNGVAWEAESGSRGRPPPVPPRRRSPPEAGVSHTQIGVSPGTTCFSKLHNWYGKEVAQIRQEWLQSQ